jgi:hypothetical protein
LAAFLGALICSCDSSDLTPTVPATLVLDQELDPPIKTELPARVMRVNGWANLASVDALVHLLQEQTMDGVTNVFVLPPKDLPQIWLHLPLQEDIQSQDKFMIMTRDSGDLMHVAVARHPHYDPSDWEIDGESFDAFAWESSTSLNPKPGKSIQICFFEEQTSLRSFEEFMKMVASAGVEMVVLTKFDVYRDFPEEGER